MQDVNSDIFNIQEEIFSKPKVGFITFGMQAEHYMKGGEGEDKEAYPIDRTQQLHGESIKNLKETNEIDLLYHDEVAWDPQSAVQQAKDLENRGADCMIYMVGGWVFANQIIWTFKNIKLPSCLWAHTDKESFAFVGSIVSHGALDNFGIKHPYYFGDHNDEKLISDLLKFTRAAANVKKLNNQIMANIGGRCMGMFNSEVDSIQVRDIFGIEVYHIDQGTIIEGAKKLLPEKVNEEVKTVRKNFGKIEVGEEKLYKSTALYLAIKEEMLRQKIFFGALKCQPELIGEFCSGCLAVSLLNDELISIACESDINASITMRILSMISKQPVLFADAEYIDFENDLLHLFNCGGAATRLCPDRKKINLLDPPDFMGVAGGVNTQFCCKKGEVTLARLDRIAGNYVMLIFKGISKYIPPEQFKDTVNQFPHAFIGLEFDSRELFPQLRSEHLHMVYGDYIDELKLFSELLNIRIIELK